MSQTTTTDEGLPQLGRWLRRWAALIVAFAVLGGVAGAAYASALAESYTSSARILIRPSVGNPFSPDTGSSSQQVTIAVATEAALVDSASVLALADDRTGNVLASSDVTATVPPNTSTIVTTARGSSAEAAQENAQALAEAFLQYREGVSEENKSRSSDQLRSQIASVREALQNTGQSPVGVRRADVLTARLVSLQTSLVEIEAASTDPGTTLTSASAGNRSGIGAPIVIGGGVLGGLLIGVLVSFALGRRDTRIHGRSAASVAGVPVLAALGGPRRGEDARAVAEADKQAFQRLRTYILASYALPSAVAVSGVGRHDRSGEVAGGLGRSMARAGYRVAVVLANPKEASCFGEQVESAPGLAEALRGGGDVLDLVLERDGVTLLSPGSGIAADQELLSGRIFQQVVENLKASHDYVLVVTGAAGLPAELATARIADGLLLVARDGVTSGPEVREVASRADLVGLHVTGLALQSPRPRVSVRAQADHDTLPAEGESEGDEFNDTQSDGKVDQGGGQPGSAEDADAGHDGRASIARS